MSVFVAASVAVHVIVVVPNGYGSESDCPSDLASVTVACHSYTSAAADE